MYIGNAVAYRTYDLFSGKKSILFNTTTRQYMFLEGLSSELFDLLVNHSLSTEWLISKELDEADVSDFVATLTNFGISATKSLSLTTPQIPTQIDGEDESKFNPVLSNFQKELTKNGLYYFFHIDLTNRCNEKCIHCYHPFEKYDYSKELSTEDVKELINSIYDLGVFAVTLSGGEALLRDDFFDILKYISEKGMVTTVFTNGLLLTEDVVKQLNEYRVDKVSISIYGDTPELHDSITTVKGSFKKTLSGVSLLQKYSINFELKCVVLAENIDSVKAIDQLSKELNQGRPCKIDFSLCGKVDGSTEPFNHRAPDEKVKQVFYSDPNRYMGKPDELKRTPNDPPCYAGKFGLYCSADGNIYPCVSFRLLLCHFRELQSIGSNPVLKEWAGTKISDFSDCFKHDYCNYCSEQCAANNLIENGDYHISKITQCDRARIVQAWFETNALDK
ncbi:MAG: radical SAM protein [Ruminococcaceae bacterium]|nr:radical SAM protein [Oscillospiraceae bacterium]